MANDCYTMYRLYGENAKKLSQDIKNVHERHKDDDPTWCKWLATDLLGYSEQEIKDGKIYVRGQYFIACDDAFDNEFLIDTDTAWNPCGELFDKLADKYELDIYWMADERGLVGIWSNDVDHHVWDWQFNIYIGDTGCEDYFSSEEDAVKFINDYLKDEGRKPITSLSELADREQQADDFYEDASICVTEIDYSDNF